MIDFSDNRLEIDVHCSKGTYIRTLAEDIGKALGCGAFLARLERTGVHPFWEKDCYNLDQLRAISEQGLDSLDQCLLPVNSALVDLPEFVLDSLAVSYLKRGQAVQINRTTLSGLLNLVSEKGQFIGIGEVDSSGKISPKRLMNTAR